MTYRKLLGAALIGFASYNGYLTLVNWDEIHPFTALGWVNEQLSISFILLIAGFCLVLSRGAFGALIAELSLAFIGLSIFLRYFWTSSAIFTLLSLLDVIYLSGTLTRARPWLRAPSLAVSIGSFLAVLAFFCLSFFGVGS